MNLPFLKVFYFKASSSLAYESFNLQKIASFSYTSFVDFLTSFIPWSIFEYISGIWYWSEGCSSRLINWLDSFNIWSFLMSAYAPVLKMLLFPWFTAYKGLFAWFFATLSLKTIRFWRLNWSSFNLSSAKYVFYGIMDTNGWI